MITLANKIKIAFDTNFTQIPNSILRDDRLSIEARGLISFMISMDDDWQFYRADIMKRCKIGKAKYTRIVGELKQFNYLLIKPRRDGNLLSGYEWIITDGSGVPETSPPEKQVSRKPDHIRTTTNKNNKVKEGIYRDECAHVMDMYNSMANRLNLSRCMKLTDKRRKAIISRIEEYSLNDCLLIMHKVEASPFLTGKSSDWRADIDFIYSKGGFLKIMEGKYDPSNNQSTGPSRSSGSSGNKQKSDGFFGVVERRAKARQEQENRGVQIDGYAKRREGKGQLSLGVDGGE